MNYLDIDIDIEIMIYLLTAVGLRTGDRSTVHIYTRQYVEQHN